MTANIFKAVCAALLFAAWGAIVFTGKTSVPGADTFISWIQVALTGLGVHAAVTTSTLKSDAPFSTSEPKQ